LLAAELDDLIRPDSAVLGHLDLFDAGKFHGTSVDRTLMSELLNDVIADYELKDRHSLKKMARPLIENRLMPYFGRIRASNVKVPTITAYMRQRKEEEAAVASINRELALLRRSFKLGSINGKIGAAHVPDFTQLIQKEKNARQGFWEHNEYEKFRDALPRGRTCHVRHGLLDWLPVRGDCQA
jgi:hypothetical protein